MKKIGKYLREISVVVIGVAITLSISYMITNRNEKRDLALYLNAIKIELEENANSFDYHAKMLQKSVRYAEYIRSHDEKSINQDSIWYYGHSMDGFGYALIQSDIVFSKNAFEMFKASGAMRLLIDKELLIYISGTYNTMENIQIFLDMCFQYKREESTREWYLQADGKHITIPMRRFYSGDLPFHMARNCAEMSELIKETLSKLEKTQMIKQ
jgi:choline kinase